MKTKNSRLRASYEVDFAGCNSCGCIRISKPVPLKKDYLDSTSVGSSSSKDAVFNLEEQNENQQIELNLATLAHEGNRTEND